MWQHIKRFFKDSETIFWARLQTALGIIVAALTYVDPSVLQPVIPAQYFPYLLVANGILTEYLRRRREGGL